MPPRINPLTPAELVIDHSVQVDAFGTRDAFRVNAEREFERNQERYAFLRWGQGAFEHFSVVPPDTGIVHQVNLEYLARVVFENDSTGQVYPDTLVGTDSHTTMINGLGVLGWGVGGIEAEAAMLGQPMSMLIPRVLGVRLHGELPEGATATDLVLTVTQMLREHGVVGMFVEFYGAGLAGLPIADRATIGNMSPEFGSTCAIFPIDSETLRYLDALRAPARADRARGGLRASPGPVARRATPSSRPSPTRSSSTSAEVVSSIAGPKRPQDRVPLTDAQDSFREALGGYVQRLRRTRRGLRRELSLERPTGQRQRRRPRRTTAGRAMSKRRRPRRRDGEVGRRRPAARCADGTEVTLDHGHVVIAAITSCTNTSNPSVMIGAGILARNAVAKGLRSKPWVKTSLAPGSKVVTEYLDRAGLTEPLEALGFNLVGYGCTTCIGNSGPLSAEISEAVNDADLAVVSVLSGNRNFEGRINPDVKMNYLASPPLCVAYALAGTMDIDILDEPLGQRRAGRRRLSKRHLAVRAGDRRDDRGGRSRGHVPQELRRGVRRRRALERRSRCPSGERFAWDEHSTYVRLPPYFQDMPPPAGARARCARRARARAPR